MWWTHPLDWLYVSLSSPPVAGVWWTHPLDWLYVSLSSPPVAGVWWAHPFDWLYVSLSSPPVAGVWWAHPLDWLYVSLSSPPVAGVWWTHPLDWFYDSLSSPPVAGVWWTHPLDWLYVSLSSPPVALSLSPCTGYQLQLASSSRHWCLHIEQSQAQHPPTSTHYYESTSPPEAWDLLVSDASWYHHREAQNHSPEHSLSPFLAGGMIFPPPSGILDPCQFSSNNWKLISFNSTWLYKKKKKKKKKTLSLFQNLHLSLYLSLLPLLACTYLNNAWDLVLLALPLYVCLFKINRFMYSPIVSRFG